MKYCFRYNQRARQGLVNGEGGERFDLGPMQRPRRRREKKLMTMDEVNERFPLTKYKVWRAGRETEGLPTTGGISTSLSRANSLRQHEPLKRVSTEDIKRVETTETARKSTEAAAPPLSAEAKDFIENQRKSRISQEATASGEGTIEETKKSSAKETPTTTAQEVKPPETAEETVGEEEDDPIRTAVPTDLLAQPGDTCAICIENLDDDDEVRGLSCGHAFHAGCLDPWLTCRRACCPLCKADYYVPKPRPEGDAGTNDANGATDNRQSPTQPSPAWMGIRSLRVFRRRASGSLTPRQQRRLLRQYGLSDLTEHPRRTRRRRSSLDPSDNQPNQPNVTARMRGFYSSLPFLPPNFAFLNRNRNRNANAESGGTPTPGQLEQGSR